MTVFVGKDTLSLRKNLKYSGGEIDFFSINALRAKGLGNFDRLPACLNVLLENIIRFQDDKTINVDDFKAFADWLKFDGKNPKEIAYRPARVLMQDFTGVPAVVDLAAMRDSMLKLGGDPQKINPLTPVDLVIDHSIMIDYFGDEIININMTQIIRFIDKNPKLTLYQKEIYRSIGWQKSLSRDKKFLN